jgi:hypothetical protein
VTTRKDALRPRQSSWSSVHSQDSIHNDHPRPHVIDVCSSKCPHHKSKRRWTLTPAQRIMSMMAALFPSTDEIRFTNFAIHDGTLPTPPHSLAHTLSHVHDGSASTKECNAPFPSNCDSNSGKSKRWDGSCILVRGLRGGWIGVSRNGRECEVVATH